MKRIADFAFRAGLASSVLTALLLAPGVPSFGAELISGGQLEGLDVSNLVGQARSQRQTAVTQTATLKAASALSTIEAAIRKEFPPTETPESMKIYIEKLTQEAVKIDKQRRGELPPDPVPASVAAASYVPEPDPTPAQVGAALAALPAELAETKGCDAPHRTCQIVRLAKQWTTATRNQGQVGSCATFASVGLLEAAYMREYGSTVDFSKMWVLRTLVGEDLSDAGLGVVRRRQDVKSYLGANPDDLLSIVAKHGMCRESSYPYNSYVAGGSDSYQSQGWSLFKQNPERAYTKAVTRFAKDYKLADDPKLANAVADSSVFKGRIAGFKSGSLDNESTANILRFLNFGIPIYAGLYPKGGNVMHLTAGHAVILAGYSMKMKGYIIRNSWGFTDIFTAPSLISFAEKHSGLALEFLSYIVGPKDIARACADKAAAPQELLAYCR
jgi:C1A family cysteine protease